MRARHRPAILQSEKQKQVRRWLEKTLRPVPISHQPVRRRLLVKDLVLPRRKHRHRAAVNSVLRSSIVRQFVGGLPLVCRIEG
jgi:hypothetical protein